MAVPAKPRLPVQILAACLVVGALGTTVVAEARPRGASLGAPSRAEIRAHLDVLADDLLEGRATGERGFDLAALYATAQFRRFGLEPGNGDSYLQPIEFATRKLESATLSWRGDGDSGDLEWKEDFLAFPPPVEGEAAVTAPLVFVGHGIEAPELGVDDYAGLDVAGKIVVVLSGAPESFPIDQRAHYSSHSLKATVADGHGAVGQITVRTRVDQKRYSFEKMKHWGGRPTFEWRHPDGRIEDSAPGLLLRAVLSPELEERLFAAAGTTREAILDSAESRAYPIHEMPVELRYRASTSSDAARSANVVAVLPGSDPALAGESIVCTAHLDHLGIREADDEGDSIHNGFFDNAVGSAMVLEMARLLAGTPKAPRRSVVFVLLTGEERGLLGSEYFARYPTPDAGTPVANVNVDMPVLLAPVHHLVAYGAEHSTLLGPARRAAARHGFELAPDPLPEETYFVRSDQYSFVREGIPAINLDTTEGPEGANPELAERAADFRENHYHKPSDETDLGLDWESALRFTATNAELALELANADDRPRWNPGDFFGDLFAKEDAP